MHTFRLLLATSVTLAGCGAAFAQAPASSAGKPVRQLTALDYIEIEQLNRKYAWAVDYCGNDGFDYADLYTPDGVFILSLIHI